MTQKKAFWIVLGLIFVLVAGGCSSQTNSVSPQMQDKIHLKIGHLPSVGHVLYFIAQEKGFFAEEGLDAELFQFPNGIEGLNALKRGDVDVGSFGMAAPLVSHFPRNTVGCYRGHAD